MDILDIHKVWEDKHVAKTVNSQHWKMLWKEGRRRRRRKTEEEEENGEDGGGGERGRWRRRRKKLNVKRW